MAHVLGAVVVNLSVRIGNDKESTIGRSRVGADTFTGPNISVLRCGRLSG